MGEAEYRRVRDDGIAALLPMSEAVPLHMVRMRLLRRSGDGEEIADHLTFAALH